METAKIAKNLKKTDVKNITINQMNIINAIKSGIGTSEEIASTIGMDEHTVKSILGTLIKNKIVVKSEDETPIFDLVQNTSGKKLQLKGDLNFPVSSFVDANGQRWVTRDSWYEIDNDIDIVNDIEWIDSKTPQNSQLKEIMKDVSNKKQRQTETRVKSEIASDAPASEEQKKLISKNTNDFKIIDEKWKLRVLEISATKALVVFSPRIYLQAVEFSHGLLTEPKIISVEELQEYLSGKKLPEYSEETVKGATDTCFIEKINESTIDIFVTRAIRGGKIEISSWVFGLDGAYKRKSVEKLELTPVELFEKYGEITKQYFGK